MRVLVTGCAGFIGYWLAQRLLKENFMVIGVDNLNPYYDVNLKKARLKKLQPCSSFYFYPLDISDQKSIHDLFQRESIDIVVNLAAQAGVRYSLTNPHAYIEANIMGFMNILEACRHHTVGHLIFASSSSVYGANTALPFSVQHNVDHPVSLYAATKKSNELMAHSYSHLYNLPSTGLRFFTVYGPWGRPDMALFKFVHAIFQNQPIDLYNHGDMIRDFTYIEDIIDGLLRILEKPPQKDSQWCGNAPNPATSYAPYRLYNIGNNHPIDLMDFVGAIEKATKKKAKINFMPMQKGDVVATHADISHLEKDFCYTPKTSIQEGIDKFVEWYRQYYAGAGGET